MTDETTKKPALAASRTKAIAYVGLSVSIMAIGSWVTVPIGPVPLTLQMFVIPLLICVLPAKWATAAIFAFIALGGLGVPLFSGFKGGIGALLGPTGGFLLAYLVAVPAAAFLLQALSRKAQGKASLFACQIVAGLVFTLIAYVGGWMQYAAVSGMSPQAAFAVSVAPFIVPDIIKVLVAAICAQPVRAVVR